MLRAFRYVRNEKLATVIAHKLKRSIASKNPFVMVTLTLLQILTGIHLVRAAFTLVAAGMVVTRIQLGKIDGKSTAELMMIPHLNRGIAIFTLLAIFSFFVKG